MALQLNPNNRPRNRFLYRFDNLCATRIIVNPKAARYPEFFLLCRHSGQQPRSPHLPRGPFLIGLDTPGLNRLLMTVFDNDRRINTASQIGDILGGNPPWGEVSLTDNTDNGLYISGVELVTWRRFFAPTPENQQDPLGYYFMLSAKKHP